MTFETQPDGDTVQRRDNPEGMNLEFMCPTSALMGYERTRHHYSSACPEMGGGEGEHEGPSACQSTRRAALCA